MIHIQGQLICTALGPSNTTKGVRKISGVTRKDKSAPHFFQKKFPNVSANLLSTSPKLTDLSTVTVTINFDMTRAGKKRGNRVSVR